MFDLHWSLFKWLHKYRVFVDLQLLRDDTPSMGELGGGVIEWQKDGIALTAEQKRWIFFILLTDSMFFNCRFYEHNGYVIVRKCVPQREIDRYLDRFHVRLLCLKYSNKYLNFSISAMPNLPSFRSWLWWETSHWLRQKKPRTSVKWQRFRTGRYDKLVQNVLQVRFYRMIQCYSTTVDTRRSVDRSSIIRWINYYRLLT